jgi:hypothetical protein
MTNTGLFPGRRADVMRLATYAGAAVAVGLGVLAAASRRFSARIRQDQEILLVHSTTAGDGVVTADMLGDLPDPVRRYLTYSGIVGKPLVSTVHLKQTGAMRPSPAGRWIPVDAEQYYSVNPPGFVWDGTMHLGPIPLVRARDMYLNGSGQMLIKAASLYSIADARGPELDQAALMRYLSEMVWFPTAFLGKNVSFEPIDASSARVMLTDHGRTATGTMYVDEEGKLTNFLAQRYRKVDGGYELGWWSTPMTEYGTLAGLNLPVRGQAVWKLPEGDFPYIDVTITELEYNAGRPDAGIETALTSTPTSDHS